MQLRELVRTLPAAARVRGDLDIEIAAITDDSRKVTPQALFVAVRGDAVDGHRFIPQARAAGAVAVVGQHPAGDLPQLDSLTYLQVPDSREALGWLHAAWHGHPSDRLTLIGVTGTDGKTTTTSLIYAMLAAAGLPAGMVSTVNALIGGESYDTGLHTTTPTADEMQAYLAQMTARGVSHAVVEVTSHGLVQHRLAGCEFDVAVVTNVTHEHLDYHGTWEGYLDAKARLFRGLMAQRRKPRWERPAKTAVLNRDDASYPHLQPIPAERRLAYSLETPQADLYAADLAFAPDGLRFTLESPWGRVPMVSPLVGHFNVSNLLAAAAAALAVGVTLDDVAAGAAALTGVPGRMEPIDAGQPFLALVDFAHTPNALRRAIEAARTMTGPGGRVIVVFGSAGLRDRQKRRLMGHAAGEMADLVVVTAEDPRTESLDEIMAETARGLEAEGRREGVDYWRVADRGRALLHAVGLARPGDVVMTCGKGHEQSMCFGTEEYPWDDREALRRALRGTTLDTLPTARTS